MWETRASAGTAILSIIDKISVTALKKSSNPDVYVPKDEWWNNSNAVKKARARSVTYSEAYYQLSKEPLIAAVLAETEDGKRRVYYFSRRIQAPEMSGGGYFTHTMAPIGDLATYGPGDTYTYNDSYDLKVLSKVLISPKKNIIWDSSPTIFHWNEDAPSRVASLLSYLDKTTQDVPKRPDTRASTIDISLLDDEISPTDFDLDDLSTSRKILADDRDILRDGGLRDQAILDKVQDGIFRLPIGSQLMISGPPGSGKTTTLVRRLAQKSDAKFLTDLEFESVQSATNPDLPHHFSWILFTPGELLEGYLSETFNREGIAAPKDRIWTWEKYSLTVGREYTNLLRRSRNAKGFVFDSKTSNLNSEAIKFPFDWVHNVEIWLSEKFFNDIDRALSELLVADEKRLSQLIHKIKIGISKRGKNDVFNSLININSELKELQHARNEIGLELNKILDGRLHRLLRNRTYDLQEYETLREEAERLDASDDARKELKDFVKGVRYSEEEQLGLFQRLHKLINEQAKPEKKRFNLNERLKAIEGELVKSMRRIVLQHVSTIANDQKKNGGSQSSFLSRVFSSKEKTEKVKTEYSKLVDFFGQELFEIKELSDIKHKTLSIKKLSQIMGSAENYFDQMTSNYREFRKQKFKTWYSTTEIDELSLDRNEMDALLLIFLKAANELFLKVEVDDPGWKFLLKYRGLLKNQVLVDEASDFSALQLAAMYQFSHPEIRSFCASGDFDQGLTLTGVRDFAELKAAVPNISEHRLSVLYRQSVKLSEFIYQFGKENLKLSGNFDPPNFGQHNGYLPAMFEANGDLSAQADWIADRITEIDSMSPELPSIAILVPDKSMVKELETELATRIENIPVVGHEEPGSLGRDQEIRIFPVQYVKGLEFEAAIFTGIDLLKSSQAELFLRYFYVGATRAATFLGITANATLPQEFKKYDYVHSWEAD